jgi:hypothetical protein
VFVAVVHAGLRAISLVDNLQQPMSAKKGVGPGCILTATALPRHSLLRAGHVRKAAAVADTAADANALSAVIDADAAHAGLNWRGG